MFVVVADEEELEPRLASVVRLERNQVYCDADDDDRYGTCINCGQVTYDLADIGETRNAGRGST